MKRLFLVLAQACLLAAGQPHGPEWVYSPEAKALTKLPRTLWLEDGTLLLQDTRRPAQEQGLDRLDPATGRRGPALDLAKARESLRAALGAEPPAAFPWPEMVDRAGRRALVRQGDGLFLLDLPSAAFSRLPASPEALLSPDGRKLAFTRGHDLYVLDLASRKETRLTSDGSATVHNGAFSWVYWEEIYDHRDPAFWWSPDSARLAFLRSDDAKVPLHGFQDFRPWRAEVHEQRYPQPGEPNPAVKVGLACAATGEVAWADLPGAFEYVVRVTWVPGGRNVAVETLDRAQRVLDLDLVDAATGAARRLLREEGDPWVHFYEPAFLEDGRHFLWASDRTGYNHLYRYDLSGRLLNPVTRGEWSLSPWGLYSGGRMGLAGVDEAGGWAYVTCAASGATERQIWKARLDGTGLARVSQGKGTHAASFSRDGRFYLDTWSSVSEPPSLTLRRADGAAVQVLAEAAPVPAFRAPEFTTVPAADGFPLPVRVALPPGEGRHPVIFNVYGGPGAPTVLDRWMGWEGLYDQLLLAEGYAVVSVDNRSSAALGMAFERSIRDRLYGPVEVGDLEAAVAWAKAQPWADPGRVGVWGWSGGGTYTLAALTRTRAFKAGIAVAPVTDWRFYDTVYTESVMKRPQDNPEGYRATSQLETAKDLHGRLLLVNGTYDDNVHPQNAQAFMEKLIQAGIPFEYMAYPMRKHTIDDEPARIHLMKTMLEFWKRSL